MKKSPEIHAGATGYLHKASNFQLCIDMQQNAMLLCIKLSHKPYINCKVSGHDIGVVYHNKIKCKAWKHKTKRARL